MITKASRVLYRATEKRAYFKDVRILIPETWRNIPANVSTWESYIVIFQASSYDETSKLEILLTEIRRQSGATQQLLRRHALYPSNGRMRTRRRIYPFHAQLSAHSDSTGQHGQVWSFRYII